MRYQKISESIRKLIVIIFSSFSISLGCAAQSSIFTNSITATDSEPLVSFGTRNSEKEVSNLIEFLSENDNYKTFQLECDNKNIAKSCYYYASYSDLILKDYKESYEYYKKTYDLGIKQAGYFIGVFQINYPDIFNFYNKLTIDESIYYLEQAFKAGSPDATRILTMTYRDTELNRINYDKAEYYNKVAIEQNVKYSKYLLAHLYTDDLKDKSKIDESIKLYKEDLMSEQNWQSALALMTIYLYPEEFGAKIEPDLVKTLAYAYVSSDLRDGRHENDFNGVDTRFIEAMEQELPAETLKQAKSLYKEIKSEMNKVRVTDSDDIASLK